MRKKSVNAFSWVVSYSFLRTQGQRRRAGISSGWRGFLHFQGSKTKGWRVFPTNYLLDKMNCPLPKVMFNRTMFCEYNRLAIVFQGVVMMAGSKLKSPEWYGIVIYIHKIFRFVPWDERYIIECTVIERLFESFLHVKEGMVFRYYEEDAGVPTHIGDASTATVFWEQHYQDLKF